MMTFPVLSALQVLVALTILQLMLPKFTGTLYFGSSSVRCYREIDIEHQDIPCDPATCEEITCPSQGPLTMFSAMWHHPTLLLPGLINILYYTSETFMYQLPFGVVMIVLANIVSSSIMPWIKSTMGLAPGAAMSPLILMMGFIGTLLAVVQYKRGMVTAVWRSIRRKVRRGPDRDQYSEITDDLNQPTPRPLATAASLTGSAALQTAAHAVPFVVIVIVSGVYFVIQVFFTAKERINVWGFTAVDQVLLPVWTMPYLFIMYCTPFRALLSPRSGSQARVALREDTAIMGVYAADELPTTRNPVKIVTRYVKLGVVTFVRDMKKAFTSEFAPIEMTLYRLLLNTRALMYFYFAVVYDVTTVFLELSLMRVSLSWLGVLAINIAAPQLMEITRAEKKTNLHPVNITLKLVGTGICMTSLWMMGT